MLAVAEGVQPSHDLVPNKRTRTRDSSEKDVTSANVGRHLGSEEMIEMCSFDLIWLPSAQHSRRSTYCLTQDKQEKRSTFRIGCMLSSSLTKIKEVNVTFFTEWAAAASSTPLGP